jgi:hypothetical protein
MGQTINDGINKIVFIILQVVQFGVAGLTAPACVCVCLHVSTPPPVGIHLCISFINEEGLINHN